MIIPAPNSSGPIEDIAFTLFAMECEGEFEEEEEEDEN